MSENLMASKIQLNFEDTQIAFESKSNGQLTKAHFLFKVMSSSSLVKLGNSLTKIELL